MISDERCFPSAIIIHLPVTSAAFTLLEMLAVTVIVTGVSAVAVVSLSSATDVITIRSSASAQWIALDRTRPNAGENR
jgi:type II secretory pathway pseudopilin PulG